ncbi:XrtA/PEP-CTERM system amidotransferase [Magnetococcales bacterium HHB-1]
MCGITGLFDLQGTRTVEQKKLSHMNRAIQHRGPDGEGVWCDAGVGLAHRRLAIIDLEGGKQPLFNEDGSVVVVFNGEIYNFQSLMQILEAEGHVFSTRSDTEVIVHAWEAWGYQCVEKFVGMFAFALWDRQQEILFLARDPLGIKPLYYGETTDGWLAFASELKALETLDSLDRRQNIQALENYFALGYVPDPMTIYQGVEKLSPGRYLSYARNGERLKKTYWDLDFTPRFTDDFSQATDLFWQQFFQSVKAHSISDVPVGLFLSGGIDSSAVAAAISNIGLQDIDACTVRFSSNHDFDESSAASTVAKQFALQHRLEEAEPEQFDLLSSLASVYDEPFADDSALPTWLVCGLARKKVKVVLSGDGGDESFAGYRRYRLFMAEQSVRARLPLAWRERIFSPLAKIYPKMDWAPQIFRAKTTFESLARDTVAGYFHAVSIIPDPLRERLYHSDFKSQLAGYRAIETFRKIARSQPMDDTLSLVQYIDFKTFLAGRVLTKVDRASMAHGLEVRVPLLDHRLVSWIAGLPSSWKLHRGEGKYLFKQSLRDRLPPSILQRKKQGFSIPVTMWLRGPLKERLQQMLISEQLFDQRLFSRRMLREMVDMHLSGRRDYGAALWAILAFCAFLERPNVE